MLQAVLDDHVRIVLRQPGGLAVGRLIEQVDVELQLLAQLLQIHGVLGRGQQRQADQVDRVGDGGGVDAGDHVAAQIVDGGFKPVRGFVYRQLFVAPAFPVAVQVVHQLDRLAEVHVHLAEMAAQHLERFHQAAHGLFFLFAAVQFADVGAAFDHLFIADVDRHEGDRLARVAQEAAHRHRQHAGARLQHAAAAAAPAFHEILDGEALGGDAVQVFVEHRRVERVVAEAAAHEEGAATAQDGAHHRQVQVDAGGDVRRHQAVAVDHERQQQIIDVAAVAGHVNDFVVAGHLGEVVQVVQPDAVVEAVPQPVEKQFQRADGGVRIVRGDLHGVAARPRQGFVLAFVVFGGGMLDRFAHRGGFHDRVGEGAPV